MNDLGNQDNTDTNFYCSLPTNLQVDTLFGLDNGISSDLLFDETPMPSLSPNISQTASPSSNRTSLDDGLRTPELPAFSTDDFGSNCEILNHHLVSDINPSLQITSHNLMDSSCIESSLLENHCNGSELGKTDSFQQKEMDISFYSNLDSIPEIPGISPIKVIESNTENTYKPLENLFEVDKDLHNSSVLNDSKKDSDSNLQICNLNNHHKKSTNNILKLPHQSSSINICSNENSSSQYEINTKNSKIDYSTESKKSNQEKKCSNQISKNCTSEVSIAMTQDCEKQDSRIENIIDIPSNDKIIVDKIFENEIKDDIDDKNLMKTVVVEETSESIEAISAAELAICQMLEAITDTPKKNESLNHCNTDNDNTDANNSYKVSSNSFKCESYLIESSHHISDIENTDKHFNVILNYPSSNKDNSKYLKDDMDVEFVNENDYKELKQEKALNSLAIENHKKAYERNAELLKEKGLDCFVYLERLDNAFIKNLLNEASNENISQNKKQKLLDHKCIKKLNEENKSSICKKSKCDICKRWYTKTTIAIHKCKRTKKLKSNKNNTVQSSTTNTAIDYVEYIACSQPFTDTETLHHHMETEHLSIQPSVKLVSDKNLSENFFDVSCSSSQKTNVFCETCNFSCKKCNEMFENESLLIKHLCYMHSNHFKKCDFCKCKFKINSSVANHMLRYHANPKTYYCHLCSFTSDFQEGLERHIWAHHSTQNEFVDKNIVAELKPCSVRLESLDLKTFNRFHQRN